MSDPFEVLGFSGLRRHLFHCTINAIIKLNKSACKTRLRNAYIFFLQNFLINKMILFSLKRSRGKIKIQ